MGPEEGRDPRVQRKGHEERVALTELLAKHGIRPDKKFGQHFLVSGKVISSIVSQLEGHNGVLEVGPGPGVLTRPMLEQGLEVVAVELDTRIVPVLQDNAPSVRLIVGGALETDLLSLIQTLPEPRAVVSNMPYNITGPLLEAFCGLRSQFKSAVLMMQREVAEKIVALPGDSGRGALSVVMQSLFEIKRVCAAPPGAFLPPPKVESTVLQFVPRALDLGDDAHSQVLTVVRAGFGQPRKTILNNLSKLWGREKAERAITEAGLTYELRPHQMTWEQWKAIGNRQD